MLDPPRRARPVEHYLRVDPVEVDADPVAVPADHGDAEAAGPVGATSIDLDDQATGRRSLQGVNRALEDEPSPVDDRDVLAEVLDESS